jgi:hypothetical protein
MENSKEKNFELLLLTNIDYKNLLTRKNSFQQIIKAKNNAFDSFF